MNASWRVKLLVLAVLAGAMSRATGHRSRRNVILGGESVSTLELQAKQKIGIDVGDTRVALVTKKAFKVRQDLRVDGVLTMTTSAGRRIHLTGDQLERLIAQADKVDQDIGAVRGELRNEEEVRASEDEHIRSHIADKTQEITSSNEELRARLDAEQKARIGNDTQIRGNLSMLQTDLLDEIKATAAADVVQLLCFALAQCSGSCNLSAINATLLWTITADSAITFPCNITTQSLVVAAGGSALASPAQVLYGTGGGGGGGVGVGQLEFTQGVMYEVSIGISDTAGSTTITGGSISETAFQGGNGGSDNTPPDSGGSGGGGVRPRDVGAATKGQDVHVCMYVRDVQCSDDVDVCMWMRVYGCSGLQLSLSKSSGSLTYYGNPGGVIPDDFTNAGSGGGGAGGAGGLPPDEFNGGPGGQGFTWNVTNVAYGAGGGGGATFFDGVGGNGGSDGGGNGGASASNGADATINSGGGGGGAGGSQYTTTLGGRGGSGVVILAFP